MLRVALLALAVYSALADGHAHTESCSVCKKGVKNPDALAGYACLDDRGNTIGAPSRQTAHAKLAKHWRSRLRRRRPVFAIPS